AAVAAGIDEKTFYNWMRKGEELKSGIYFQFFQYIKECQAKAVELHLKLITKAANEGSWQASAWILERRHPEEFGRRENVNVKAEVETQNNIPLTDEVIEASHNYLLAVAKARQEKEE
ncbi:MAG: hypothetical protein QUS12_15895, partial [Methanosarcina sp.]|nr:hypothetical protein [Methanosarcina sp.]